MEIAIREIEEKDYPAATALLGNELWDHQFTTAYVVPYFQRVKNDENYKIFVALLDGAVVGLISTVTTLWAVSPFGDMLVQGFVVQKAYRNQGIGTKLLKHAEEYAESKGIIGIGLASGAQRTAAHAFYEHNGYSKGSYHFSKRLNPIEKPTPEDE